MRDKIERKMVKIERNIRNENLKKALPTKKKNRLPLSIPFISVIKVIQIISLPFGKFLASNIPKIQWKLLEMKQKKVVQKYKKLLYVKSMKKILLHKYI